jgi:hypothetical protein
VEKIVEEGVEKVVEEVVEEIVRIRSGREVKKARWSLLYYQEMKKKRDGGLKYRVKLKVARHRRG